MNAPAVYHGDLIPFADLQKMAAAIAESGLFGMKDTKQALGLMLTAQAEGQHPATITQDYDIIQGKATRKTHSVLARYQQAGGSIEWHALTDAEADATFTPPASAGKPLRMKWTIVMAKAADLTGKDNWRKYPRAMLRARCIAEGVRATYPAAIGGMLLAEEAQDMDSIPGEVTSRSIEVEQPRAKTESATPASASTNATAGSADPAAATSAGGGGAPDQKDVPPMKPSQVAILKAKLAHAALTETDLEVAFSGKSLEPKAGKEMFTFADFGAVQDWISKNSKA